MGWLTKLLRPTPPAYRVVEEPPEPKLVIPQGCFSALLECLAPAKARGHEGVAFLLGRTDGATALCVQAVRPKATTSPGSFHVSARDMARVIELAANLDLQVVGQVHTHPRDAFHSDGDEDGANIRFDGFVSLVIPDYGARLPDLIGSAAYVFSAAAGDWKPLPVSSIHILHSGVALG